MGEANRKTLFLVEQAAKMADRAEEKSALCLKCGWCCQRIYLPLAIGGMGLQQMEYRGIDIKVHKGVPYAVVEQVCQHLHPIDGCDIYDQRPLVCRVYDGRNDLFYPEKCMWKELS
jgi:Fe-S-cluster containining protein